MRASESLLSLTTAEKSAKDPQMTLQMAFRELGISELRISTSKCSRTERSSTTMLSLEVTREMAAAGKRMVTMTRI